MNCAMASFPTRKVLIAAISVAVFALVTFANAQAKLAASSGKAQTTLITCGAGGPETLPQIRDAKTDLKVVGICYVNATIDTGRTSLLWVFHNVSIVSGGSLIFQEREPIDFYAESILVEYKGALTAVSSNATPGYGTRLTIHLWGAPTDDGIECQSHPQPMKAPCGIPDVLWMVNTGMADNLMMQTPPAADQEESSVHFDLQIQPNTCRATTASTSMRCKMSLSAIPNRSVEFSLIADKNHSGLGGQTGELGGMRHSSYGLPAPDPAAAF